VEVRDRLIELLESTRYWGSGTSEEIADYLLANGVIAPPYKVGDTAYYICRANQKIEQGEIGTIAYWDDGHFLFSLGKGRCSIVDKNEIFLTKEAAEQAMKGGAE
jgi:hypothetical protein